MHKKTVEQVEQKVKLILKCPIHPNNTGYRIASKFEVRNSGPGKIDPFTKCEIISIEEI